MEKEGPSDTKKRKRPARKQADPGDVFEDQPHTGFYNIWYDRVQDYSTWRDRRDAKLSGKRFKLDLEKDVGETMAKSNAYICLFFARGKCIHGHECKYKHSIPTYEDEAKLDLFHDCFGRERHRTDRDDMGGVGSFNRENHTLYIGGVRMVTNVEEIVKKYFGKFGEIADFKILPGRSIVFITYKLRVSAEFAKEAMSDQSLIGNEVLNVRWANEDPNPQVQHQKQDKLRAEAWEQMQHTHPDFFKQYELLEQQKYPDTNAQYSNYVEKNTFNEKEDDEGKDDEEFEEINWAPKNSPSPSHSPTSSPNPDKNSPTSAKKEEPTQDPEKPTQDPEKPTQDPEKPTTEPPKNQDPKEAEYEAWQTWYQAQGYPSYVDYQGKTHYYDPRIFDPYASGYAKQPKAPKNSTKKATQKTVVSPNVEVLNEENFQEYDPSQENAYYTTEHQETEGSYDYYNYYASLEVGNNEGNGEYWNGYFQGYSGEQEGLSNAPLYQ